MAVVIKLLTKNQPLLLDLTAGKPRKTLYAPHNVVVGPWTLAALGIGAAVVLPGVYRMFTGPSERAQAIERLKVDQLEAKLNHDNAKIAKLEADTERIRLAASPSILEEREAKTETIRQNLPLDLWRKQITNEALELELTLNRELAPTISRAKDLAADNLEALIRQRQEQHEEAIDLAELAQERAAAEAERVRATTEQIELNTRLLETAVDGMDFFSKQIFLRDRLFPKPPEPRGFISPTGIRTITAF